MLKTCRIYVAFLCLFASPVLAQEPTASPSQPSQRITGAITAVNPGAHTVTVKEDKTGTAYTIELQNTKSLRKVDPSTLELKKATRITADDLMVGDRVQVFALKADDSPNALAAKGVILISARELQSVHQEQASAWQHSTGGVVTQVDAGGGKFSISARTPQGPKPLLVDAQKAEFTRYAPENPKAPAVSNLGEIQVGDQVRVIGDTSTDGSAVAAQKIYSSAMRMLVCTVSAVSPDGKSITVKDLQTKQAVTLALNDDSAVRKLPPMVAFGLARRLNPEFKPAPGTGERGPGAASANAGSGIASNAGAPPSGARPGEASLAPNRGPDRGSEGPGANGPGGGSGGLRPGGAMRNGDVSQMLERLPKISATDLKPGDAVVVSGTPIHDDKSHLLVTNVIAGVEPIFQSASPRQMQSLGDWGLSSGGVDGVPAQ